MTALNGDARRESCLSSWGWHYEHPVCGDSSGRHYVRVQRDGQHAILMMCPPDSHPESRAGHRLGDWLQIGAWLADQGFKTPEIYESDPESGCVLMEDFGDVSFAEALERGVPAGPVYALATDVLRRFRTVRAPPDMPPYGQSVLCHGRRRFVDWYLPLVRKQRNPPDLAESFLEAWAQVESALPSSFHQAAAFVHGDFHPGNLMWRPEEEGLAVCGLLDFQGAVSGSPVYDLVNLLEDVRRDVPAFVKEEMIRRYCADIGAPERESFPAVYSALAASFQFRVAGQFIRLAIKEGKKSYLAHLPRTLSGLQKTLRSPALTPLRTWCLQENINWDIPPDFTAESCIAADAF